MELMERRRILLNTPHINIITGLQFVTDMVAPLESLVIDFSPIQDLHGYDSPWLAGGGKNLFQAIGTSEYFTLNDDGSYTLTAVPSSNKSYVIGQVGLKAGNSYILSGGFNTNFRLYTSYDGTNYTSTTTDSPTIVCSSDATVSIIAVVTTSATVGSKIYPMVRLASSSSDYAPYSNICPISGRTGLDVTITGKNLFNGEFVNMGVLVPGGVDPTISRLANCRSFYIPVESGTYTISRKTIESNRFRVALTVDVPDSGVKCAYIASAASNDALYSITVTVPKGYNYLFVYLSNQSNECTPGNYQVERGSTATTYEPYHGTTYHISWQTEAGTVYGGSLDVTTGLLTVTHALYTFDGSSDEVWTHYTVTQGEMFRTRISERKPGELTTIGGTICDSYKVSGQSDRADGTVSGSSTLIDFINNNYSTTAAWTANLAEHPVNIVCELNTPSTYQLTPQQVLALKGVNNLSMSGQVKFWTHRD